MVPGKTLHNSFSSGPTHAFRHILVLVERQKRLAYRVAVTGRYDDSVQSINNHIAGFARRNLRKAGCGSFIGRLCTSLAFRGKDKNATLAVEFFNAPIEPENLDRTGQVLQVRLNF